MAVLARPSNWIPAVPSRRLDWKLLDLVFPPRCTGCRRAGAWICDSCWSSVSWLAASVCPRCEQPSANGDLCLRCRSPRRAGATTVSASQGAGLPQAPSIAFRAVARFEGSARQAIHELKYSAHYDIATVLGPLMATRVMDVVGAVLVPVPLHPSRRRERGYNQSELLARRIRAVLGCSLLTNRLRRRRNTGDQVALDALGRWANVGDAFEWRGKPIDAPILLIDDVSTTGATLNACAAALQASGMTDIRGLVFASVTRVSALKTFGRLEASGRK